MYWLWKKKGGRVYVKKGSGKKTECFRVWWESDPRITVFRGVPYAKPPVGELRWRAPQPAENWEGVRKCYEYGDMPMMRVHPGTGDDFYTKELHPVAADYGMSEDCLYLNIFSPAAAADENLPVFCYIHGGGLQDGYSYEVEFDRERVARRGVIVVMIGYRLGLFGFLAHPEITARTPEGESDFQFRLPGSVSGASLGS